MAMAKENWQWHASPAWDHILADGQAFAKPWIAIGMNTLRACAYPAHVVECWMLDARWGWTMGRTWFGPYFGLLSLGPRFCACARCDASPYRLDEMGWMECGAKEQHVFWWYAHLFELSCIVCLLRNVQHRRYLFVLWCDVMWCDTRCRKAPCSKKRMQLVMDIVIHCSVVSCRVVYCYLVVCVRRSCRCNSYIWQNPFNTGKQKKQWFHVGRTWAGIGAYPFVSFGLGPWTCPHVCNHLSMELYGRVYSALVSKMIEKQKNQWFHVGEPGLVLGRILSYPLALGPGHVHMHVDMCQYNYNMMQ